MQCCPPCRQSGQSPRRQLPFPEKLLSRQAGQTRRAKAFKLARKRQGLYPTSQNHLIHCQARGYLGGFLTQLPQTYNLPSLTLLCFLHISPQLSVSPFLSRIPEPSGHTSICSSQERILVSSILEGRTLLEEGPFVGSRPRASGDDRVESRGSIWKQRDWSSLSYH